MDGPRECHTEWTDREGQIPDAIPYRWTLKNDTNRLIHKTETDSQRTDLWLTGGERAGLGIWD